MVFSAFGGIMPGSLCVTFSVLNHNYIVTFWYCGVIYFISGTWNCVQLEYQIQD